VVAWPRLSEVERLTRTGNPLWLGTALETVPRSAGDAPGPEPQRVGDGLRDALIVPG